MRVADSTTGRPEAAAAIWDALRPSNEDAVRQANSRVRRGALLRWSVGMGVAALAVYVFQRLVLGGVIFGVSTAFLLLVLASPVRGHGALQRVLSVLTRIVGTLVTWVLLAPLFYLVITPFGWLRRRGAHDPLHRQFDAKLETYWSRREDGKARLDRPY